MQFLLNLLFPKFCIGCNLVGSYICADCFLTFNFLKQQHCPYCLQEVAYGKTHSRCLREGGLDGAYSILIYKGITKVFIKNIKYRRMYAVLDDFFKKLPAAEKFSIIDTISNYKIDYIQSIPLHPMRKKLRGFNQSDLIAQQICRLVNIPIINILTRTINTSPQAQISKRLDRVKNMNGAFECFKSDLYVGKNILLVDDLFTTGSTTKEAANELKKQGIATVFSFTLAHG